MAQLTVQTVSEDGLAETYANADTGSGDKVTNKNGDVILRFKNPGASSATATISAQNTTKKVGSWGNLTRSDIAVALAAGEEKTVGPFGTGAFNDANGDLNIAYSGAGSADIDVAALKFDGLQKG